MYILDSCHRMMLASGISYLFQNFPHNLRPRCMVQISLEPSVYTTQVHHLSINKPLHSLDHLVRSKMADHDEDVEQIRLLQRFRCRQD